MKKPNIYPALLLLTLAAACQREEFTASESGKNVMEVYAAIEENSDAQAKTSLEGNQVVWTEGDQISVLLGDAAVSRFNVSLGSECSTEAVFQLDDTYKGEGSNIEMRNNIAWYPFCELVCTPEKSEYTLSNINLPDTQDYAEWSFAPDFFPMVAVTKDVADHYFSFRNVCGAIMIQLQGSGSIKSVSIRGNSDEILAGEAIVRAAYNEDPSIILSESGSGIVTLDCGRNGVELKADEPTPFIIVLPPVAFEKGFNITISDSNGRQYSKATQKSNTIRRSSILKMPVFSINDSNDPDNSNIEFGDEVIKELCIKAFDTNGDGELSMEEAAAVTDLSKMTLTKKTFKSFNELKYFTSIKTIPNNYFKGIPIRSIILPENISIIKSGAFENCTFLTEIVITANQIEYQAFKNCISLESVIFADNVTSVGQRAFDGCSKIAEITIPENIKELKSEAFAGCQGLASIRIEENSISTIPYGCFEKCISLDNVVLPECITEIQFTAFADCTGLTDFTITRDNITIEDNAFKNCISLKQLTHNGLYSLGEGVFSGCYCLEEFTVSGKIKEIPDHSFENCSSLKSIILSENITSIGDYAFSSCSELISVNIPEAMESIGDYAFCGCSSLESIDLESVQYIYDGAFQSCTSLKEIRLCDCLNEKRNDPNTISPDTFSYCTSLETVRIPETVYKICNSAFRDCSALKEIEIPESVGIIDSYAFYGCSSIEEITIPESVIKMGSHCFALCKSAAKIDIPESLTSIPSNAFYGCTSLTEINIPESITNINGSAFRECSSLTAIRLPMKLESIGQWAFMDCSNLKIIEIPDGVVDFGEAVFSGCTSLYKIKLPSMVEYIADWMFVGCTALESIDLPEGIKTIGELAFKDCCNLSEIILPEGVTEIGKDAFYGCHKFQSITIPSTVTSLGKEALGDCNSLTTVYMKPVKVPQCDIKTLFGRYNDNTPSIYVPEESLSLYKTIWVGFRIYGYSY